ncbi:MAG: hypothetical protein GY943_29120, partial [Chloroflexi bacterium]|nr:hypothetical protein [Chloroflexota bacterium]
ATIEVELADPISLRHHVFTGYHALLQQRAAQPAFDPNGEQQIIHCHPSVFAVLRMTKNGRFPILCLHNVANATIHLTINLHNTPFPLTSHLTNVINQQNYVPDNNQLVLTLEPYQILWLTE